MAEGSAIRADLDRLFTREKALVSLEEHLRHPEISMTAHIARRRAELAARLAGRRAIYLDLRYWVIIREVRAGLRTSAEDRKLVHHLEAVVTQDRAFCPITDATFMELMKIGNPDWRMATARLVDEFSCGVSLIPEEERIAEEADAFMRTAIVQRTPGLKPSPWTSLSYVLGPLHPTGMTRLGEADQLAVQKAFFDYLWTLPLAEMAGALNFENFEDLSDFQAAADQVNAGNAAHAGQMTSFEAVLEQEFQGMAELCAPFVDAAVLSLMPLASTPSAERRKYWCNAIRLSLQNPEHARRLPTAHVQAVLHALLRWEFRQKKIEPNDFFDYMHGAAALGYCCAYLGEKGLAGALRHQRLKLAEIHDCYVTNRVSEAGEFVRKLRRPRVA